MQETDELALHFDHLLRYVGVNGIETDMAICMNLYDTFEYRKRACNKGLAGPTKRHHYMTRSVISMWSHLHRAARVSST